MSTSTAEQGGESKTSPIAIARAMEWLLDVKSDDPNVVRRAQTHIRLMLVFVIGPFLIAIISAVFSAHNRVEGGYHIVRLLAGVFHLGLLFISRAGYPSIAGIIQTIGLGGILSFGTIALGVTPEVQWFFSLVIIYAGLAVRPKIVPVLGVLVICILLLTQSILGFENLSHFLPKVIIVVLAALAMYLQGSWNEAAFSENLKAKATAEKARIQAEELQRKAEAASETKSQFLANMSHELRTPLNAIIGYADMIEEEFEEDPGDLDLDVMRADIKRIHKSGSHLLSLINDILDLAKLEAGRMQLFKELLHIDSLLAELDEIARPLANTNNNTLTLSSEVDRTSLVTDHTRLRQILLNLLSNACKFTEQGQVELRILEHDGTLRFEVSDTGIGIDEEQLTRIFDSFAQADNSTTRRFGGTGLGLSLSQHMATMLGGAIEVESIKGEGSTFTLILPLEASDFRAIDPNPASESSDVIFEASGQPNMMHVLVVDDEQNNRALLERMLGQENIRITMARDGIEALECLEQEPDINAVLLDLMMPKLDGFGVLERLDAFPNHAKPPVIIITAKDLTEQERGFVEQRANKTLFKAGLTRSQLLEQLFKVLGKRQHAAT